MFTKVESPYLLGAVKQLHVKLRCDWAEIRSQTSFDAKVEVRTNTPIMDTRCQKSKYSSLSSEQFRHECDI